MLILKSFIVSIVNCIYYETQCLREDLPGVLGAPALPSRSRRADRVTR